MATPAVSGDPAQSFEDLYRTYVRDVYRYTLAVVRDPAEAEDLTQATFLRAWRAYRDGVLPRAPQNWFLRIAHNVLRTHFRDRSRRPRQCELPDDLEAATPGGGPTAADVLAALADLPLAQREALVMRELEGRSYGEIAEIMGVSKTAVETLIFRARRKLRLRHRDLRGLASLPLPGSLASFFRDRVLAEGFAAAAGSGAAAKAAAVVAAGLVAVGAGKEALDAARPAEPADVRVGAAVAERPPGLTRAPKRDARVSVVAPATRPADPAAEATVSKARPAERRQARPEGIASRDSVVRPAAPRPPAQAPVPAAAPSESAAPAGAAEVAAPTPAELVEQLPAVTVPPAEDVLPPLPPAPALPPPPALPDPPAPPPLPPPPLPVDPILP